MQSGYRGVRALGYAQSGAVDASTLVSSLSFAGTAGIPTGTSFLTIKCETQAVRWRDDGTAPTAAVGYPLSVGSELVYDCGNMAALRFISQVAGAIINVVAYGQT